jgi:hypothetical protein
MEHYLPGILLSLSAIFMAISLIPRVKRIEISPQHPTQSSREAGSAGEKKVYQSLTTNCHGLSFKRDFAFHFVDENGEQSTAQIDCVVKGKDRVYVLECKNWAGTVEFLHSGKWRVTKENGQVDERWSPILQAERQAECLSRTIGVPVTPFVVMTGSAKPLRGYWPRGCISLEDMPRIIGGLARNRRDGGVSTEEMTSAWMDISSLAALDANKDITHEHEQRMIRVVNDTKRVDYITKSRKPRLFWVFVSLACLVTAGWLIYG